MIFSLASLVHLVFPPSKCDLFSLTGSWVETWVDLLAGSWVDFYYSDGWTLISTEISSLIKDSVGRGKTSSSSWLESSFYLLW